MRAPGCTSGHGLTGLARLTSRSWVAVPTFMGVAMVVASALGTLSALPPDPAAASGGSAHRAAAWAGAGIATLLLVLGALSAMKAQRAPGWGSRQARRHRADPIGSEDAAMSPGPHLKSCAAPWGSSRGLFVSSRA